MQLLPFIGSETAKNRYPSGGPGDERKPVVQASSGDRKPPGAGGSGEGKPAVEVSLKKGKKKGRSHDYLQKTMTHALRLQLAGITATMRREEAMCR